jgi:hypothetical protein
LERLRLDALKPLDIPVALIRSAALFRFALFCVLAGQLLCRYATLADKASGVALGIAAVFAHAVHAVALSRQGLLK